MTDGWYLVVGLRGQAVIGLRRVGNTIMSDICLGVGFS